LFLIFVTVKNSNYIPNALHSGISHLYTGAATFTAGI